jgi:hypothetical protein
LLRILWRPEEAIACPCATLQSCRNGSGSPGVMKRKLRCPRHSDTTKPLPDRKGLSRERSECTDNLQDWRAVHRSLLCARNRKHLPLWADDPLWSAMPVCGGLWAVFINRDLQSTELAPSSSSSLKSRSSSASARRPRPLMASSAASRPITCAPPSTSS